MFTDTYLPSRDGVVTSILNTRKELQSLGHEVFLFAPEPKDQSKKEADVYYFRAKSFSRYQGYTIPMFPTDKCRILRELDVEVIHAHGLLFQGLRSMFAGRTLQLPVVITWHTMVTDAAKYYNFTPLPPWVIDKLMWRYLKSLIERADCVVAPTMTIRDELLLSAPHMRRIEVIPTGIDVDHFVPGDGGSDIRRRLALGDGKVILTLGRIAWEKNLVLLRREVPDVKLIVAGEGPAKEHYQKMSKELGLGDDVLFTGFISDADLPQLYAACDAFTIASKFETQGLVILEAMASGKAVSGIDFRAVGEIIQDGWNGFKYSESPEKWAEATISALNASDSLKRNARATAERYSLRSNAERLAQLYQETIEAKRARLGKT
jgi:1,2-diacylglycerol 3-alpha-glucosyltransferase